MSQRTACAVRTAERQRLICEKEQRKGEKMPGNSVDI